jgi:hypothetical protein
VCLISACRLFEDVTQWQRFAWPDRALAEELCPSMLMRIAASAGLPDGQRLKAHLDDTRAGVLACLKQVMPGGWV